MKQILLILILFFTYSFLATPVYAQGSAYPASGRSVAINNVTIATAQIVSKFDGTKTCLVLHPDGSSLNARCTVGAPNGVTPIATAPTASVGYEIVAGKDFVVPWSPILEVDCISEGSSTTMSVAECHR